jgi:hypothetical protein
LHLTLTFMLPDFVPRQTFWEPVRRQPDNRRQ